MSKQRVFALSLLSSVPGSGGSVPTQSVLDDDLKGFEYAGKMVVKRYGHDSTLLQDGRVPIAGGASTNGSLQTFHKIAEIFDPESGTSSTKGSLSTSRMEDTGILLHDGRVVFPSPTPHSGDRTHPLEIYDPQTGKFTAVPSIPPFEKAAMTKLLPNGHILTFCRFGAIAIIVPETGQFVYRNRLTLPRGAYTATMLRSNCIAPM